MRKWVLTAAWRVTLSNMQALLTDAAPLCHIVHFALLHGLAVK